jgi:hypothetical protein
MTQHSTVKLYTPRALERARRKWQQLTLGIDKKTLDIDKQTLGIVDKQTQTRRLLQIS